MCGHLGLKWKCRIRILLFEAVLYSSFCGEIVKKLKKNSLNTCLDYFQEVCIQVSFCGMYFFIQNIYNPQFVFLLWLCLCDEWYKCLENMGVFHSIIIFYG